MKRLLFLISMAFCLLCLPVTGYAKTAEEEAAEEAYTEAISDNYKEMLKTSIALDKITAENKTHLLVWQDEKDPSEEAKKLVEQIKELEKTQEKDEESLSPYTKAKKACDEKLNAEGANAALKNIIRIQKDQISDQEELAKLWAKVDKLLKKE